MADEEVKQNIETIKSAVRQSFNRIYASLKARELKTLRQLDALHKQCEINKDLAKTSVQNINISYDNESILLENINSYGVVDFETLNFDGATFSLEDYVSPNDDHMYLYKTLEELPIEDKSQLEAIEEDALKQITTTEGCVCQVTIKTEEVSKKFRHLNIETGPTTSKLNNISTNVDCKDKEQKEIVETLEDRSDNLDSKKIEPTDDWMNSIKNQTETEPSQVSDVMEHSTIACS